MGVRARAGGGCTTHYISHIQAEIEEMVDLYKEKGFSEEEAKKVLDIMSRNKDFFVDHMLVHVRTPSPTLSC